MTRRDYVRLAAALNRARPEASAEDADVDSPDEQSLFVQWCRDVQAISDALQADNPRFDAGRFWDAADAPYIGDEHKRESNR